MRKPQLLLIGSLLLGACSPDPADATPIGVELDNDRVTLNELEVATGPVLFEVKNVSVDLVHEIEVFSNATEGALLPVVNTVADTSGLTLLDEVEDVVPGSSASLAVNLEPGTYLIICNLPEHYDSGMWAYLTVTGN